MGFVTGKLKTKEECLIPKEVFAGLLSSRLNSEGMEFSGLTLVYPSD